ncbi:actin-related protein 5 [Agrilus planipennis]|uniref:Actin-related protein 5 n=1 Tax=Agrilus planipennis TaxID=224129 RepID=A0A1W4XLG6_AGRPL|nr:actin-related protein 5 [Agrilus planipennis]
MELLEFKDWKSVPDIVHCYKSQLSISETPIIIDNGSYQARVGWAISDAPLLSFRNLVAKLRRERSKKDGSQESIVPQLQVANDISNIEAVRFQLKTQFDRNVVTHFEAQELLLDYSFFHLGINTDGNVAHPVIMTEAFLNPNSSRQIMTELLFECYGVPGIMYGVDSLFSFFHLNTRPTNHGLIVGLGYHTVHVIPVVNGKTIFENVRRINIGGSHIISFLHRILQLKYPAHNNAITLSRAEELLHSLCLVALDYKEELKKWSDNEYYKKNIKRIQLPFSSSISSGLTEQQKERKRELARRLAEINARKREERLAEDEEKLQQLLFIQQMIKANKDSSEIEMSMLEYGIKNLDDLHKNIVTLNSRIEKAKEKIFAVNTSDDVLEEPPLKQPKFHKMSFENETAKLLFVQKIKKTKQEILNKKSARKQRRQDMAKRRTAAGQERMRIISQLARKEKGNDDFGYRDEDWDIYKAISREGGDSDSDAENEKLMELDEILREYQPTDVDQGIPGESYQLHVGIERYRAPELLFKPYMIGSSEAGLSEVIAYVLSLFDNETQSLLAENVVLVGSLANLPGLMERIKIDLISVRPFKSNLQVHCIGNPDVASWLAMKNFVQQTEYKDFLTTREEYEEYGSEFFKTHAASNFYIPTPKSQVVEIIDS